VKGKVLGRRHLTSIAGIVTPDTILQWYRRLVAQKNDGSNRRRPGRPSTKPDIAALVVRFATENPTWGYTRIRGGLKCIGHDVSRNTIKAILKDLGIEPAPARDRKMSWKTFLAAHGDGIAAADFFTVEVLTRRGWVRYVVFFVLIETMRRDFERKLGSCRAYYNAARCHASLEGGTPLTYADGNTVAPADLNQARWVSYCSDLVQLTVAA
jgi:hypothetical protein